MQGAEGYSRRSLLNVNEERIAFDNEADMPFADAREKKGTLAGPQALAT